MIKFNKNDKLLKNMAEDINSMPIFKTTKGLRDLHLYGVASTRKTDIVTPTNFPYGSFLQNVIAGNFGLKTLRGTLWDLAETYNNRVLGLGFDIRKNNYDACKKIVILHYLALNGMLEVPEKYINDNDTLGEL